MPSNDRNAVKQASPLAPSRQHARPKERKRHVQTVQFPFAVPAALRRPRGRARHGLGADQAGRDRGGGGRRRRLRPDGAHDAGRGPEEQSDEAADGGLAQGRRVGRRGADVHEVGRGRPEQVHHRLFADLHAAAVGQAPVRLARAHPGLDHGVRPVRAVGQRPAALQDASRNSSTPPRPPTRRSRWAAPARSARTRSSPSSSRSGPAPSSLYLPYKSGGEAATQLVGNHTQANVNNPSENLEVWRAGQVRALCVFDKAAHRVQDQGHRHAVVERHSDLQGAGARRRVHHAARHLPARQGDARADRVLSSTCSRRSRRRPNTRTTWRSRRSSRSSSPARTW